MSANLSGNESKQMLPTAFVSSPLKRTCKSGHLYSLTDQSKYFDSAFRFQVSGECSLDYPKSSSRISCEGKHWIGWMAPRLLGKNVLSVIAQLMEWAVAGRRTSRIDPTDFGEHSYRWAPVKWKSRIFVKRRADGSKPVTREAISGCNWSVISLRGAIKIIRH